ncbi:mitochondrial glycoprotein [Umbelopsis sp. PMI_123]|nr:mitochondrial glycoprotein [Umbelopsis sp. PMI_123]
MATSFIRNSLSVLSKRAVPSLSFTTARITPRTTILASNIVRPFSIGTRACFSSGKIDNELIHKLDEEILYEKSTDEPEQPAFIQEFLEANSFKLEDKPGMDEVTLTRTFGNEKIRVLFAISDINNAADDDFADVPADDVEGEDDDVAPVSFPVRASVTIEKDGKGAVTIDTVAQDGAVVIESVLYYKDGKLATEQSAEADWQRRGLYIGPQFSELDEGVQTLFERYLEERGINTALANFLPDYVEYKEQKEYLQWLQSVKSFVAA